MGEMTVIGITGGIASGKSLVTGELRRLGAAVVDADAEGHAVLATPRVRRALVNRWGEGVLDDRLEIDRSAVARRVFAPAPDGPRELAFLEQVTHPRIRERLIEAFEAICRRRVTDRVVLDAALLHEAGWAEFCDRILFVDCATDIRRKRAELRGWSIDQLAAREAAQMSLADKRQRADITIHNSGSIAETERQIEAFWRSLDKTTK